jgi:hypothetical protein
MSTLEYGPSRPKRFPGEVFACLKAGEFQIIIFPGYGLADGGGPLDVPLSLIPVRCRIPNCPVWIWRDAATITAIEWRDPNGPQSWP